MEETTLINQVIQHHSDSNDTIEDVRNTWDEKEDMLIGNLTDSISANSTKSQIYDPRLATIIYERVARVSANQPKGKTYAISKDDIGKNKLMNMILDKYVYKNANSQFSFMTKVRLMDLYSLVYGVQFTLVDWCDKDNYEGPDFWLLPIRDCFPQPGACSIEESDWFQVATLKSKKWLESRKDLPGWKNIDVLLDKIKGTAGTTRSDLDDQRKTSVEEIREPNVPGDKNNPKVQIITEYRKDKWITFSKEHRLILREIDNPHQNNKLPIVAKHSFPLLDSIYGLGEFERGKTLQYAINSLINLYMDGVKFSLYPPLQINEDGVVPSSIKWGPAEKWLVDRPNVDVQVTQMSPQGLNTFQSTYSFLIAALMNQSGTTDTTISSQTDVSLGKTPEALKMIERREGSRDSWDRFMLEQSLTEITERFINLITIKLKKPVAMRLFEDEVAELEKYYPDTLEIFESGRGMIKVKKDMINVKYDYEIEPGSTAKKDPNDEQQMLTNIMQISLSSPQILASLNKKGKDIDFGELYRRWIMGAGVKDPERIIVEQELQAQEPQSIPPQIPQGIPPQTPQGMPPQGVDPDIARAMQEIMSVTGGMGGVPSAR